MVLESGKITTEDIARLRTGWVVLTGPANTVWDYSTKTPLAARLDTSAKA
ncbi:MAG: hypothetical protein CM1200mP35_01290 [Chloroflexota bacterium]|nr:MAG: hypothetical protein CM1200mP35_01290 [Chloroflexota bacterium]